MIETGKPNFTNIINKFENIFHKGTYNRQIFKYLGVNVKQNEDLSITVDQQSYTDSINFIPLNRKNFSNSQRKSNGNKKSHR